MLLRDHAPNRNGINMDNSTAATVHDDNSTILSEQGFAAFYKTLLLIEVTAGTLAVLAMCALCCNFAIPRAVAAFLISQLIFCLLTPFCREAIYVLVAILALDGSLETPPKLFCQFLLWGGGFTTTGRMWSLVAFSIVAFIIIKHGIKVFKRTCPHCVGCGWSMGWHFHFIYLHHPALSCVCGAVCGQCRVLPQQCCHSPS